MTPKKKATATSSESTSSSNSSSSSSTSSSSSGSESSSSDSENSSTSQASAAKSGHGSTDSETRNKVTKKKPAPSKTKANAANATNEADTTKSKEKSQSPTKSRTSNKANPIYSSESEGSHPKPNPKRKPPAKPKASATVTPVTKQTKQPAKGNNSASTKQTAAKSAGNNNSAANKKSAQAEKDTTKASNKQQSETAAQKKSKTKSIFSPENSSESDDQTTPPPKLSPMKSTATKASSAPKPKPKATAKPETVATPPSKSGASSASSTSPSSASSESSSDSESSVDSSATTKPTQKKTAVIKKSAAPPGVRARVETPPQSKGPSSAVESGPMSESDGEGSKNAVVTRKLTRSSSARSKSKHLVGKTSDTESEAESKTSAASKSPVKKAAGPKGPCPRKTKGRGGAANSDASQTPAVEERRCPLDGCDSMGHLGGRAEKHFTIEACPMYHNKTAQECKELYQERRKRDEERKKALATLSKKCPKSHHLTIDQRHYQLKIKDLRTKSDRRNNNNNNSDQETDSSTPEEKDREPRLTNITSEYDLKLFQEAQAVASEKIEDDLKGLPHVKGTKYIEIGKYEVEVWYQSPYPEDYARVPKLYLCEYCLRYMKSKTILKRHVAKCVWRHPPGEEVYRKEKISVWEVDGKRYKQYCQNLCLLAKFFLDHKTLYYDVEPFLFYVMTIGDAEGCHTVGYFSKEKNSFLNYNVSCILTLPPYQRQGYGRLLIDFSYLLTRVEGKVGSPEKPLSDLGLISYRSYWKDVLLEYLCNFGGKELSVKDISQEMAINSYDIVSTLQALGMMKYWKGKHIILKKQDVIDEYVERMKKRGAMYKEIDPEFLKWTPFVAPANTGPT